MDERIKQWLSRYQQPDQTRRDIMKVKKIYVGLDVTQEPYTFSNGITKNLVKLTGTIPVPFKGKTYHIPVAILLMDTHPINAPLCFVVPTAEMCLKPSKSLDHVGKVYLPYLHNWNRDSTLVELIQVMIVTFSESPPVYSKRQQQKPTQQASPYPTQNFQYPGYPPYPAPATQPVTYPPYPPTTSVSSPYPPSTTVSPPYPLQPASNLPFPSYAPQTQSNSVSSASSPSNTGTITDEHIRASLMSAIEDKIRRKINEQTALCHDEIEILSQTQRELIQGKHKLDTMFEDLEKERESITEKIQILKDKEVELEKTIEKLSTEEDVDVDDAIITTTPLYKQILNTHCEDAATEDTIYYIGEALRMGVIDVDIFTKQLRTLSRKRLLLKSLLEKCRMKAGLPVYFV